MPELALTFQAGGNVAFALSGAPAGIAIASVSRPGEPPITTAPFELPFESGKTLQVRLAFGTSPNQTFVDYQVKLRGLPSVGDTVDLRPQWRGQASPTNIGSASIAGLSKTAASSSTPFEISYTSGTAYTVPATATQTGTWPDVTITHNGVQVVMQGTPSPGDRFLFQPAPLTQNGDNAKALLGLRDAATFDNGTTLGDGYIPVLAGVSSLLQEGKFNAEFSTQQAEGAETRRANAVGVNLDEEAARMLQFQQAYQASARYLQTAQSLFDTLLASVGR
jgi:flagellar hook-associated protein FlgK